MKAWKRNLLIAYLICDALLVVFFYLYMLGSLTAPFLKFLLFILGLVVIAGIFVGIYAVIYAFMHEHATLHSGPGGAINIERSALESTARRALASVPAVSIQKVTANVIERKNAPIIDFTVVAVPRGTDSLMALASAMQGVVKQSIETFTDREVRYVAVNFIEPRRRSKTEPFDVIRPRDTQDCSGPCTASSAEHPVADSVPASEEKASLWSRIKTWAAASHAKRDEDVLETDAVVETVTAETDPEPTSEPTPLQDERDVRSQKPEGGSNGSDDGCPAAKNVDAADSQRA